MAKLRLELPSSDEQPPENPEVQKLSSVLADEQHPEALRAIHAKLAAFSENPDSAKELAIRNPLYATLLLLHGSEAIWRKFHNPPRRLGGLLRSPPRLEKTDEKTTSGLLELREALAKARRDDGQGPQQKEAQEHNAALFRRIVDGAWDASDDQPMNVPTEVLPQLRTVAFAVTDQPEHAFGDVATTGLLPEASGDRGERLPRSAPMIQRARDTEQLLMHQDALWRETLAHDPVYRVIADMRKPGSLLMKIPTTAAKIGYGIDALAEKEKK